MSSCNSTYKTLLGSGNLGNEYRQLDMVDSENLKVLKRRVTFYDEPNICLVDSRTHRYIDRNRAHSRHYILSCLNFPPSFFKGIRDLSCPDIRIQRVEVWKVLFFSFLVSFLFFFFLFFFFLSPFSLSINSRSFHHHFPFLFFFLFFSFLLSFFFFCLCLGYLKIHPQLFETKWLLSSLSPYIALLCH